MLRRQRFVLRPGIIGGVVKEEQAARPKKRVAPPKVYPKRGTFAQAIAEPNEDAPPLCSILGCGRPTEARAGKGLSLTHCRYHVQYRNRHGSYFKGTYAAAHLEPYRRTALRYLGPRASRDSWIKHAIIALQAVLNGAGPVERVVDAKRIKPRHKARAVLARVRENGATPMRLLVNYLAAVMALAEDQIKPGADGGEYLMTQIGKIVHRMGAGQHTGWDRYSRSSGLVLRHIGRAIDTACELVAAEHLKALLECKAEWYEAAPR